MEPRKWAVSISIGIIIVISFLVVNGLVNQPESDVIFETNEIKLDDITILVQLADTPEKTSLGLQFQEKLSYDEGMLFVFDDSRILGMWMPNMEFSLDMIFFDEEGQVVTIAENVPPCEPDKSCPNIKSESDAKYVLEVTSGFVDKYNITLDSQLDLSDLTGTSIVLGLAAFAQVPDYYDPYSPIFTDKEVYTWTDKVHITVVAPSWNANKFGIDSIGNHDGHFIKISTSENSLKPYKLTETDFSSGVFTGEVILTGFLHDVDGDGILDTIPRTSGNGPTNGFLEADRDGGITISFEFADGVTLTHSALISWNVGEITFLEPTIIGESTKIRVIDPDMNLNPEILDRINVEVSSDSDVAGITVEGIETSEDSGLFETLISFTQNSNSSGNRLFAVPGDSIYSEYHDNTLPSPYSKQDALDIQTKTKLESDVPLVERISHEEVFLADSFGIPITEPGINEQLQIVGVIHNNQNYNQSFSYIIQIKDQDATIVALFWINSELAPNQKMELSQSWSPKESGDYVIESFVWNSLTDTTPLSMKSSISQNIP